MTNKHDAHLTHYPDDGDDTSDGGSTAATTDIMIVDTDNDCADALQLLLSDLPGVGAVQTARTANDAIHLLHTRQSQPDDVNGFSASAPAERGHRQIIFLDAKSDQKREAALEGTLAALRRQLPDAAIVLLCLYPDRSGGAICSIADRCVPKDTSYHDLRALINDLRTQQHAISADD